MYFVPLKLLVNLQITSIKASSLSFSLSLPLFSPISSPFPYLLPHPFLSISPLSTLYPLNQPFPTFLAPFLSFSSLISPSIKPPLFSDLRFSSSTVLSPSPPFRSSSPHLFIVSTILFYFQFCFSSQFFLILLIYEQFS